MNNVAWSLILFILASSSAHAAEIEIAKKGAIERVKVSGPIKDGDYEEFREVASRNTMPHLGGVILNSPGGNLLESMEIGRLIRTLLWETHIPTVHGSRTLVRCGPQSPYTPIEKTACSCKSACFFIFVSGIHRSGNRLSIHRPSLTKDVSKNVGLETALSSQNKVMNIVRDYLLEMNVPLDYADRMDKVPSNEEERLPYSEVEDRLYGYIPAVEEWLNARCGSETDEDAELGCGLDYLFEQRREAFHKEFGNP